MRAHHNRVRFRAVKVDRQRRTRQRLLEAGTRLFSTYGLRRTSMEGIADEAGVAKATAYAHFDNKDAVFAAVVDWASQQMIDRAEAAAAKARTPEQAVLASLTHKQLEMFELVHRSPHAAELLEAIDGAGAEQARAAHRRYEASLARHLGRAKGVGPRQAKSVAALLDAAAWGLAGRATDAAGLKASLTLLVQRVVGR